jgi:uncharacterized protein (TIGR01370 family)
MATLPFLYQLQNASFGALSTQSFRAAVVDMDESGLTAAQLNTLHTQNKVLFTYLSIGEAEDYREYWTDGNWNSQKPSFVLGENPDWPGNFSVKFWDPAWQAIMYARVDDAIAHGYDGIYLDIVDAYEVPQVRAAYTGPDIRQAMIDFVVGISKHAKALDPDFKIIPQNAVGLLALSESNPDVPNTAYLNAIDGIGVEDLWYDGNSTSDWTSGDLEFLKNAVNAGKFVLATSYPTDDAKQEDFVNKAIAAGFVPFVADRDLTGKIDPTDLTIDTRMAGHDIDTPWGQTPTTPTTPVPPVINTAPVAAADLYNVAHDKAFVVGTAQGVLRNDTDANGNKLTAITVSGPSHGTVVLKSDGSFTYTPTTGFSGEDSFSYKANDGKADSNVVTVKLNVAAATVPPPTTPVPPVTNTAPVAAADLYNVAHDKAFVVGTAQGVLRNDTDTNGNKLTAIAVSGPSHGTVVLKSDGSFTYTPTTGFSGEDSFSYKANDGKADSNVVTVKLNVAEDATVPPPTTPVPPVINRAPVAGADLYNVAHDKAFVLSIAALGVLRNDTDANGNKLAAIAVDGPSHGTVVLKSDGTFIYTPTTGFSGEDSFSYKANDGKADSNVVTVKLNVAGDGTEPVPPADSHAGNETITGTRHSDAMDGGGGSDYISGMRGSDTLHGGAGDDVVLGGSGSDTLYGDAGSDYVFGESGNDTLNGGSGNDVLIGGSGADILIGSLGADRMVFKLIDDTGNSASTRDIIMDFDPTMDRIDVSQMDANADIAGNQAFTLLATPGAAFTAAGQLHLVYTTVNGVAHTIVEGNVNKALGADFQIDLVGHIKPAADDFLL